MAVKNGIQIRVLIRKNLKLHLKEKVVIKKLSESINVMSVVKDKRKWLKAINRDVESVTTSDSFFLSNVKKKHFKI